MPATARVPVGNINRFYADGLRSSVYGGGNFSSKAKKIGEGVKRSHLPVILRKQLKARLTGNYVDDVMISEKPGRRRSTGHIRRLWRRPTMNPAIRQRKKQALADGITSGANPKAKKSGKGADGKGGIVELPADVGSSKVKI